MMTPYTPLRPFLASAVALLALAGCERKSTQSGAMPPQSVDYVTMHTQSVVMTTSLPGRTDAFEIAQVRPQVTGIIQKRLFIEGADVVAGQQLYQIDPSRYQAAYTTAKGLLEEAEAAEITARAKLDRYRNLVKDHAVSRQEYDDALATEKEAMGRILNAKGQVESAQVNLNYTKMNAPITGRIGRTLITVGALVTANQTNDTATITRLDPIYVDVNMPAITLLRLKRELAEGRLKRQPDGRVPVSLTLEDNSAYEFKGRMALSEVNVNTSTSSVVIRAIMPNPQKLLLPGMYVHAQLEEGTDPNSILVPQKAVSHNSHGDPEVWVIKQDDTVERRKIQTSQALGDNWLVTAGLQDGDRVVVTGLQKIKPGGRVKPTEVASAQPETTENLNRGH